MTNVKVFFCVDYVITRNSSMDVEKRVRDLLYLVNRGFLRKENTLRLLELAKGMENPAETLVGILDFGDLSVLKAKHISLFMLGGLDDGTFFQFYQLFEDGVVNISNAMRRKVRECLVLSHIDSDVTHLNCARKATEVALARSVGVDTPSLSLIRENIVRLVTDLLDDLDPVEQHYDAVAALCKIIKILKGNDFHLILARYLGNQDSDIRELALGTVGRTQDSILTERMPVELISALVRLSSEDDELQLGALRIMHRLPPTTEVPRHSLRPIIIVLKQNLGNNRIAKYCLSWFGRFDDISDDELMLLYTCFSHPMDSSVELALGSFLLKPGFKHAAPYALRRDSSRYSTEWIALEAMSILKNDPRHMKTLAGRLSDSNKRVRAAATRILLEQDPYDTMVDHELMAILYSTANPDQIPHDETSDEQETRQAAQVLASKIIKHAETTLLLPQGQRRSPRRLHGGRMFREAKDSFNRASGSQK